MTEDRRNDIGYKTTITVFGSALAIILGLFVNAAWTTANEGKNIGYEVKADLGSTRADFLAKYEAIKDDLQEIKLILKRTTPLR